MVASCATQAQEAEVSLAAEEEAGSGSLLNGEGCKHSGILDESEAGELRSLGDGLARGVHDARGAHSAHGDGDGDGADGVHVCAHAFHDGAAHGGHFDDAHGARGAHGGGAHCDHFGVRVVHFGAGGHGAHDAHYFGGGALGGDDAAQGDVGGADVLDVGGADDAGARGAGGVDAHGVGDGGAAVHGATLSSRSDEVGLEAAIVRDDLPEGAVGPGSGGRMPGTSRHNVVSSRTLGHEADHQDQHDPIG